MAVPLPEMDLDSASLTVLVAWMEGSDLAAGELGVGRDVGRDMRVMCASFLEDVRARSWQLDEPEAYLHPDEGIYIPRATIRPTPAVLDVLDRAPTFDTLDVATLPHTALRFYAIILGSLPSGYIAFLRRVNPHKTYKGAFFTVLSDSLVRPAGPVFQFDHKVDLVITANDVYVLSTYTHDLLFRGTEHLSARIPAYMDKIVASLPVGSEAATTLQGMAAKSSRLLSKLRALSERDYLKAVTVEQVAESARKQGIDPSRLIQHGQLVLDDSDPNLLIELLNEDLYMGDLSRNAYAAQRKTVRSASKPGK